MMRTSNAGLCGGMGAPGRDGHIGSAESAAVPFSIEGSVCSDFLPGARVAHTNTSAGDGGEAKSEGHLEGDEYSQRQIEKIAPLAVVVDNYLNWRMANVCVIEHEEEHAARPRDRPSDEPARPRVKRTFSGTEAGAPRKVPRVISSFRNPQTLRHMRLRLQENYIQSHKDHREFLIEEMSWLARDVYEERKWQTVTSHLVIQEAVSAAKRRQQRIAPRTQSSIVAGSVQQFWLTAGSAAVPEGSRDLSALTEPLVVPGGVDVRWTGTPRDAAGHPVHHLSLLPERPAVINLEPYSAYLYETSGDLRNQFNARREYTAGLLPSWHPFVHALPSQGWVHDAAKREVAGISGDSSPLREPEQWKSPYGPRISEGLLGYVARMVRRLQSVWNGKEAEEVPPDWVTSPAATGSFIVRPLFTAGGQTMEAVQCPFGNTRSPSPGCPCVASRVQVSGTGCPAGSRYPQVVFPCPFSGEASVAGEERRGSPSSPPPPCRSSTGCMWPTAGGPSAAARRCAQGLMMEAAPWQVNLHSSLLGGVTDNDGDVYTTPITLRPPNPNEDYWVGPPLTDVDMRSSLNNVLRLALFVHAESSVIAAKAALTKITRQRLPLQDRKKAAGAASACAGSGGGDGCSFSPPHMDSATTTSVTAYNATNPQRFFRGAGTDPGGGSTGNPTGNPHHQTSTIVLLPDTPTPTDSAQSPWERNGLQGEIGGVRGPAPAKSNSGPAATFKGCSKFERVLLRNFLKCQSLDDFLALSERTPGQLLQALTQFDSLDSSPPEIPLLLERLHFLETGEARPESSDAHRLRQKRSWTDSGEPSRGMDEDEENLLKALVPKMGSPAAFFAVFSTILSGCGDVCAPVHAPNTSAGAAGTPIPALSGEVAVWSPSMCEEIAVVEAMWELTTGNTGNSPLCVSMGGLPWEQVIVEIRRRTYPFKGDIDFGLLLPWWEQRVSDVTKRLAMTFHHASAEKLPPSNISCLVSFGLDVVLRNEAMGTEVVKYLKKDPSLLPSAARDEEAENTFTPSNKPVYVQDTGRELPVPSVRRLSSAGDSPLAVAVIELRDVETPARQMGEGHETPTVYLPLETNMDMEVEAAGSSAGGANHKYIFPGDTSWPLPHFINFALESNTDESRIDFSLETGDAGETGYLAKSELLEEPSERTAAGTGIAMRSLLGVLLQELVDKEGQDLPAVDGRDVGEGVFGLKRRPKGDGSRADLRRSVGIAPLDRLVGPAGTGTTASGGRKIDADPGALAVSDAGTVPLLPSLSFMSSARLLLLLRDLRKISRVTHVVGRECVSRSAGDRLCASRFVGDLWLHHAMACMGSIIVDPMGVVKKAARTRNYGCGLLGSVRFMKHPSQTSHLVFVAHICDRLGFVTRQFGPSEMDAPVSPANVDAFMATTIHQADLALLLLRVCAQPMILKDLQAALDKHKIVSNLFDRTPPRASLAMLINGSSHMAAHHNTAARTLSNYYQAVNINFAPFMAQMKTPLMFGHVFVGAGPYGRTADIPLADKGSGSEVGSTTTSPVGLQAKPALTPPSQTGATWVYPRSPTTGIAGTQLLPQSRVPPTVPSGEDAGMPPGRAPWQAGEHRQLPHAGKKPVTTSMSPADTKARGADAGVMDHAGGIRPQQMTRVANPAQHQMMVNVPPRFPPGYVTPAQWYNMTMAQRTPKQQPSSHEMPPKAGTGVATPGGMMMPPTSAGNQFLWAGRRPAHHPQMSIQSKNIQPSPRPNVKFARPTEPPAIPGMSHTTGGLESSGGVQMGDHLFGGFHQQIMGYMPPALSAREGPAPRGGQPGFDQRVAEHPSSRGGAAGQTPPGSRHAISPAMRGAVQPLQSPGMRYQPSGESPKMDAESAGSTGPRSTGGIAAMQGMSPAAAGMMPGQKYPQTTINGMTVMKHQPSMGNGPHPMMFFPPQTAVTSVVAPHMGFQTTPEMMASFTPRWNMMMAPAQGSDAPNVEESKDASAPRR